ncbi:hypothetical protein CEXT_228071 [Caerostris extrusa]|uniref:Uncharacterized protein n=1 Tax=Caerostris extrusa TaxID=172846 RepID=A0AAV4TQA4_CAEEX|nr:hypothetical protein CEXT_228071 [Caerostris extrusa]
MWFEDHESHANRRMAGLTSFEAELRLAFADSPQKEAKASSADGVWHELRLLVNTSWRNTNRVFEIWTILYPSAPAKVRCMTQGMESFQAAPFNCSSLFSQPRSSPINTLNDQKSNVHILRATTKNISLFHTVIATRCEDLKQHIFPQGGAEIVERYVTRVRSFG